MTNENRKQHLIDALKAPLWTKHPWPPRAARTDEADLRSGVRIQKYFPDPQNLLATAYADLEKYFYAGDVPLDGVFQIITEQAETERPESFQIIVAANECRIQAADAEGIRRGIFYIEDEMCRARGAFLPLGTTAHAPHLKRRIGHCYYAPIKRPGNHAGIGDELLDEVDYYPDEYLNRLAHEGVNGLWIILSSKDGEENSVGFGDLVSTFLTTADQHSEKRLEKLRKVVEKCARYGIRVYLKTMEPHLRFAPDDPRLEQYPDLAGNFWGGYYYLCAGGESGQRYLSEATYNIFAAVPGLGGIVNISHGELYTTCLSALHATGGGSITCPRCSQMPPAQILYSSLSAMQRGMREAAPDAELISWLYMPEPQWQREDMPQNLADWVYDIPAHTPEGVILQFNFDSGIRKTVFGKELIGGDYWLSEAGPSDRFERIAVIARQHGTTLSAKIQTGTSHEVATVPYVPALSQLYKNFSAMRRLGVTHVMLNWNIGNAPGLMNKAAGELSLEPFPADESTFMQRLAAIYWKEKDISQVTQAWRYFSEAYAHFPLTNLFQYYGPMHDGPVWPLHLKPQDTILSPTYQLGSRKTGLPWPPSGDRIGECFPDILSLEEVVELCRQMSDGWNRGVNILTSLKPEYTNEAERLLDIGVATALGIQFRSGYNILRFYLLREKMLYNEGLERLERLQALVAILEEEQTLSEQLAVLCENDARLGYHPDAEGYKYFPEKLRWRIQQLQSVLDNDVPVIRRSIEEGKVLFPEYTGNDSSGAVAYILDTPADLSELDWQTCEFGAAPHSIQWAASRDADSLIIHVRDTSQQKSTFTGILVKVEPCRLYPAKPFYYELKPEENFPLALRIPLEKIGLSEDQHHPIRMNVQVNRSNGEIVTWHPQNPLDHRLMLGSDNPADLGWLCLR